MERRSQTKVKSTHAIFRAALDQNVSPTYAHTLAECLYWSQHAKHSIDGLPAVYKTGPELSEKLGIAARTVNRHLKKLAKDGFWRIEYRSRPSHPSPVSWLVICERSTRLLAGAASSSRHELRDLTLSRAEHTLSNEQICDVQAFQDDTTYRDTDIGDEIEETSFISGRNRRKNETHLSERRGNRAPKYVKASREMEDFVYAISVILEEQGLQAWDMTSRFTWNHCQELLKKLRKAGHETLSDKVQLVRQILADWTDLRNAMEWRYSSHAGNLDRPTPMALNHQFGNIMAAFEQETTQEYLTTDLTESLDDDFG